MKNAYWPLVLSTHAFAFALALVGCGSTTTASSDLAGHASANDAASVQQGDAGSKPSSDGGADDGGPVLNGTFSFNVDGKQFVANSITISQSDGRYLITANHEDGDGINFDSVVIQYGTTSSGTDACGNILGVPERVITYGRYFRDNGQVATEKQFLSGLPGSAGCTFTISGHSPESGSAMGSLTSDKALVGGGPVPPPVTITLSWSGINP